MELQDKDFLCADDVGDKNTAVFLDEGEYKEIEDKRTKIKADVLYISVEINKTKKIWTPNYTSRKAIKAIYGNNTTNWIGKTVKLITIDKECFGEIKKVIYVDNRS